jgi:hypothetical protein
VLSLVAEILRVVPLEVHGESVRQWRSKSMAYHVLRGPPRRTRGRVRQAHHQGPALPRRGRSRWLGTLAGASRTCARPWARRDRRSRRSAPWTCEGVGGEGARRTAGDGCRGRRVPPKRPPAGSEPNR